LTARRPSITVGGRRVSISSATIIDEVPPIKEIPTEGITPVLEETEEEHTPTDEKPTATPNVESKRHSKRKSQLRQSYFAPIVEITETDYVPEIPSTPAVVDDRLLTRISAIEQALAARGIGAVDFAVHDDGPSEATAVGEEENEDFVPIAEDEKKHSDAQSMV
ncbi:hypothetical protein KCU67_g15367, partial [Aureobasidium melanogenum]